MDREIVLGSVTYTLLSPLVAATLLSLEDERRDTISSKLKKINITCQCSQLPPDPGLRLLPNDAVTSSPAAVAALRSYKRTTEHRKAVVVYVAIVARCPRSSYPEQSAAVLRLLTAVPVPRQTFVLHYFSCIGVKHKKQAQFSLHRSQFIIHINTQPEGGRTSWVHVSVDHHPTGMQPNQHTWYLRIGQARTESFALHNIKSPQKHENNDLANLASFLPTQFAELAKFHVRWTTISLPSRLFVLRKRWPANIRKPENQIPVVSST